MQPYTAPSDPSDVMRTLADPTRRSLYEAIVTRGETSVIDLTRGTDVSQPAVSQHLKALRAARLVNERREGRNNFYSATPDGLAPLVDWVGHYGAFWRDRMTALRTLLSEIDPK
ncbi:ArsR/SmtB family transcription factor [Devosia sp.]|uniref:ArsR/SmtB family transcription factor n=1 Tax=Devosia sp. TaxID=1871048 RepID=UPI003BA9031D